MISPGERMPSRFPCFLLLGSCAQASAPPAVPPPAEEPAAPPAPAPTTETRPATDLCHNTTPPDTWTPIAPGIEHAWRRFEPPPEIGCNRLDVVRVDPKLAPIRALTRSELGGRARTAMAWCEQQGAVVTINAGMFDVDFVSHVGFLRDGAHTNQALWRDDYRSALVWEPGGARIVDDLKADRPEATGISQNLRLIAGPGRSVWTENGRRWSEAALAQDEQGRLLLLHTRAAFSMAELNRRLLAMPLGVTHAMHLEGGPEASLAICALGHRLERMGSFETGFAEDNNVESWPLPNALAFGRQGSP